MRMRIGEYGNRRRDTLPYPVYVTNNKHGSPGVRLGGYERRLLSSDTHAPTRAREIIELFGRWATTSG